MKGGLFLCLVISVPSQRRPSWPSLTTPRHLTVSGGKTCLSEQYTKASQLHTHNGCATSSPTEKPNCRSTETEADSYHYARDFLKDLPCRRSSFCCTLTIFGESYPKTWRWPCLLRWCSPSTSTARIVTNPGEAARRSSWVFQLLALRLNKTTRNVW